ncbi:MAG: PBP1A family penicillin-binding protein [Verrucomicrobiales bacterium]|nr:PBP1A family penicillin-binding protein [Verrucomicrobiales bacterium]MED5586711.1 PBP1A family penicillin-binding protein [Verrucomicrobiota bacterium]
MPRIRRKNPAKKAAAKRVRAKRAATKRSPAKRATAKRSRATAKRPKAKGTRTKRSPAKRAKKKRTAAKPGNTARPPRKRRRWILMAIKLGSAAALVAAIGMGIIFLVYSTLAKKYDLSKLGRMPARSIVFDRNGEQIGLLHGSNRIAVPLQQIPQDFIDALLSREDARFYGHGGVDPIGVIRAVYRTVIKGKTEGASTITMQLARNSFNELMSQKTLHRKLVEVMLARRIEESYTKEQILEFYVNRIFFGSGIYGIELASRSYFGKPASQMTLSESAMLAGIIRGPNRFSPFRHYKAAVAERDTVLNSMLARGIISREQHRLAKAETVTVLTQPPARRKRENSYALDAIRQDLQNALSDSNAEDGGLKIYTTIDLRLQRHAEAALERRLKAIESQPSYRHPTRSDFQKNGAKGTPGYLQGAMVLLDNSTGGTLAILGGRDIDHSQFNRATAARRQVGSAFKPFVYAAALDRGMMPGSLIDDNPLLSGEIAGAQPHWNPKNADGTSLGLQGADFGLIKSRNTMAVRVGDTAGIQHVCSLAKHAGIAIEEKTENPQLFIGNLECDLKSLTSAYTIFPNTGARVPAFTIRSIVNARGETFYRAAAQGYPAAPPAACAMTAEILQGVLAPGGSGHRARQLGYRKPAGGKTGTTNDFKDAWFIGFTDKVTCGVWAGLDQPRTIMPGAYGSNVALPIWTDIMLACERFGYPAGKLQPAIPMTAITLCRITGCVASSTCQRAKTAYRTSIPRQLAPRTRCRGHRQKNTSTAKASRKP